MFGTPTRTCPLIGQRHPPIPYEKTQMTHLGVTQRQTLEILTL